MIPDQVPDRQIDPPEYPEPTAQEIADQKARILRDMSDEWILDGLCDSPALVELAEEIINQEAAEIEGLPPHRDDMEIARRFRKLVLEAAESYYENECYYENERKYR